MDLMVTNDEQVVEAHNMEEAIDFANIDENKYDAFGKPLKEGATPNAPAEAQEEEVPMKISNLP